MTEDQKSKIIWCIKKYKVPLDVVRKNTSNLCSSINAGMVDSCENCDGLAICRAINDGKYKELNELLNNFIEENPEYGL